MQKKTTPQREVANQNQFNHNNKISQPIDEELRKRVKRALPHLTKVRCRLVLRLLFKGRNTAGGLCSSCSVGNLSDAVIKMNPVLNKFGLKIINCAPPGSLINSFGEKTLVHYWELVSLDGKKNQ